MKKTIAEIKRAAAEHGSHFFDKEAKAFFNSRIFEKTYNSGVGTTLFITSERFSALSSGGRFDDDAPTLFTVRESRENGSVHTVGRFQQHATKQAAMQAARSRKGYNESEGTK